MKTARRLFSALREGQIPYRCLFRFPDIHVLIVRAEFEGLEDDERDTWLGAQLGWSVEEVNRTAERARLKILLCTQPESDLHRREPTERGEGWLREFLPAATDGIYRMPPDRPAPVRTLHFHGYKGGQARSSCLAVLSKALATDGWRVLLVDADLEAPSLDLLFGRFPSREEATLLGLEAAQSLSPDRVYVPALGQGYVDLIACRPVGDDFDIEAVALATRFALDPRWGAKEAALIGAYAVRKGYDLLLIDHRAGLSPFTLPWLHALPGPVVAFARLDRQWMATKSYLPALFRAFTDPPGVVVSFAATGETTEEYLHRNRTQVDALLALLVESLQGAHSPEASMEIDHEDGDQGSPTLAEIADRLVVWPQDSAFRRDSVPDPSDAGSPLQDAVYTVRRLLELTGKKEAALPSNMGTRRSGADDATAFIATPLWRELLGMQSTIRYLFGRKGTGKTRLLRQLAESQLGEPLLIDPKQAAERGWDKGGLATNDQTLLRLHDECTGSPRLFFWTLFACAMAGSDTSADSLRRSVNDAILRGLSMERVYGWLQSSLREHSGGTQRRVFLIDGLESGFPARNLPEYIDGLFQTLSAIQTDPQLRELIDFRVLVRPDLVLGRIQNLEQQIDGQSAYLHWDTQTIFNFTLSRIPAYPFYREAFPQTVKRIESVSQELLGGVLELRRCDELLLEILPARLPRHNVQTLTFLRTYFCDGNPASDRSNALRLRPSSATYYPRIFDTFFRSIANKPVLGTDGKVAPSLVLEAHEAAAADFLEQVRQELLFQMELGTTFSENSDRVGALVQSLRGEVSPFGPSELADRIAEKTRDVGLTPKSVGHALRQMKALGLFEEVAATQDLWRVGRLFKSSLGMKFSRSPAR